MFQVMIKKNRIYSQIVYSSSLVDFTMPSSEMLKDLRELSINQKSAYREKDLRATLNGMSFVVCYVCAAKGRMTSLH